METVKQSNHKCVKKDFLLHRKSRSCFTKFLLTGSHKTPPLFSFFFNFTIIIPFLSEGCGRKLQLFSVLLIGTLHILSLILRVCPLDIITTFLNCVCLDSRTLSAYQINVSVSTLSSMIHDDKRNIFQTYFLPSNNITDVNIAFSHVYLSEFSKRPLV